MSDNHYNRCPVRVKNVKRTRLLRHTFLPYLNATRRSPPDALPLNLHDAQSRTTFNYRWSATFARSAARPVPSHVATSSSRSSLKNLPCQPLLDL
ncbi:hypothetical protein EVAR_45959_1 [Eumeta japonica]|uniref:Uncharacterized protein n=1 Tax=Eumeta variegata TaxID=151549 RepID=A0A4C1YKW0_EUMVA|nr:hypothetical protein EVAR_45959_1 [Eumeta japonica]